MSKRDAAEIVTAENALLDAISASTARSVPQRKIREYLFKLLFVQASLGQKEGTRLVLQVSNALASQAYFKKARGYLEAARKLAEGMEGMYLPGGRL